MSGDLFSAFVPVDRRQVMVRGLSLPDRTRGAALFADISGFTPLTKALSDELGRKQGAEEVLRQINPVYEALIAELESHGGSVIGFAGDSITCWLDDDPVPNIGGIPANLRAVACALAMQSAMAPFAIVSTPAGTTISLGIKVAVACGPSRRFLVGDPAIQVMDALAGATLERMTKAEHFAETGEVVVSEEVAAGLDGLLVVEEWRVDPQIEQGSLARRFAVVRGMNASVPPSPWPEIARGALTDDMVRPWILAPIYARLQAGGAFLGDLRPVVPLFLKFGGIQYDQDESAGEKLDAFVRWVQSIVNRYEGFIVQLTIGDKGSYFYAAFGAPVAHEDDSDRAVAAALELIQPPPNLAFVGQVQIGISKGQVWTGSCGASTRSTYGVMGNQVNLSARLMSIARPGQILVSERIVEASTGYYQFNGLGSIDVKGREEPLPVAEVLGRKLPEAPAMSSRFIRPLVGRDELLAQMDQTLTLAIEGKGQLLSLLGEAGIGKSHLTATFSQHAIARGVRIAMGACQSTTQAESYHSWRQLFRTILGLDGTASLESSLPSAPGAQLNELEARLIRLNPDWHLRFPLVGDLLGVAIPDNPTTATLDPRLRREALFALVGELVAKLAQSQPLLLIIEDIQWMDEVSLALTGALVRQIETIPVMILLEERPRLDGDAPYLPGLDQMEHYTSLTLPELSISSIATLLEERLVGRLTWLALEVVQAKGQGNPFFIEEMVDALEEAGQLQPTPEGSWALAPEIIDQLLVNDNLVPVNGDWALAESADLSTISLGIPESIQGIILSRLDRLPESHKLSIKVASVIGNRFDLELVDRAHPVHPGLEVLAAQARVMEAREFIRFHPSEASPSPGLGYTFRQQTIQEVAYETLLFAQRRQLHREVAVAWEQLHPEASGQIAYHAFLGGDWPRALQYQLAAGRQAQQLFANQQGIDYYRKALVSAEQLPAAETRDQRQKINMYLGELLTATGQYDPGLQHLHTALKLATDLDDHDARAHTCRWIARSYELRGEYPPALEWLERGLGALSGRENAEALEMGLIAGLIYTRQGNYESAEEQCLNSLQAAEQLGETQVLGRASTLLGIINRLRGETGLAIDHIRKALDLYEAVENVYGQATSHNEIANVYFQIGQWTEADFHYRHARAIFHQIGDIYNRLAVDNNLGGIALNQGRMDEALEYYQTALRSLKQIGGSLWVMGMLHMNLGAVYVRRAELEAARDYLLSSLEYFDRAQSRDFLPEVYRHLAEAALQDGDLTQARDQANQGLQLARELDMRGEQGSSLRVLGEIALAQELAHEADRYLEESIAILDEVGERYECARARLSLAQVQLIDARPAQALTTLEASIAVFQSLDASLDLAAAQAFRQKLG